MKTYIITYWREINDEKVDIEKEIEAETLEEALNIFLLIVGRCRIESIIEKRST